MSSRACLAALLLVAGCPRTQRGSDAHLTAARPDSRPVGPATAPDSGAPRASARSRGAVAALVGQDLHGLLRLLRPGRSARLEPALATFLDDQPDGDDGRVDAGVEALHLATFLTTYARDALPPGLGLDKPALARYRARVLPRATSATKLASELSFDARGRGLARRSHRDRTARYWRPHFKHNKRLIMQAVREMQRRRPRGAGRPLVMALGAGSSADIPLREMVQAGCDVILVDLDLGSLQKGVALQLPPGSRKHVRLELRDLSGGVVDQLSRAARAIIRKHVAQHSSAQAARAALDALMRRQLAPVPQLEGAHRVDLLVSSLLVGQLPVFPLQTIEGWFERDFKQPLVRSREEMLAQSELGDRLFAAHFEALADFVVRSHGVVYLSSDLFAMPSLYEPKTGKVRYGHPRPVMGLGGQPLPDLDLAFEGNPALALISASARGQKGRDHWIWEQQPAQLATKVESITVRRKGHLLPRRGKRGMARVVDAVILVPASAGGAQRP